jgi:hypothetical protein
MELIQELSAILRELIDDSVPTADTVAARLSAAQCRGLRGSIFDCPVQRWVAKKLTRAPMVVTAGSRQVLVDYASSDSVEPKHLSMPLPEAVCSFIIDFDSGRYPELEVIFGS